MVTFSSLKKKSGEIDRLTREIEKANSPTNTTNDEDLTYWTPTVDKQGNGFAIIRFLPEPAIDGDEALPWAKLWSHSFQGPGGWYIEKSLTTLGKNDPVSELNSKLWKASEDDDSPTRKQARAQKRKLTYISNILVVSDSKNPDAEGKVFRYKYGKKIFDKIQAKLSPEVDERTGEYLDPPVNVFDFWEGANFRLKIKQVAGYRNYDESVFAASTPVSTDDALLEKYWKESYSLKELVAPESFKKYEELAARLAKVLGEDVPTTPSTKDEEEVVVASPKKVKPKKVEPDPVDDEDDPDLSAFKRLVEED